MVLPHDTPAAPVAPTAGGEPLPELAPGTWTMLRAFQREGVAQACFRGSHVLWWGCGGGKTFGGIVWALAAPGAVVVFTLAPAREQWIEELSKVAPAIDPYLHRPASSRRKRDVTLAYYLLTTPRPFLVLGWESLHDDDVFAQLMALPPPFSIVWDELSVLKAHRRFTRHIDGVTLWVDGQNNPVPRDVLGARPILKDLPPGAHRDSRDPEIWYEPCATIAARAAFLAPRAARRLGLTATFVPDRVRDIWAQLDAVLPGCAGKYRDFAVAYCAGHQGKYGWVDDGASDPAGLRTLLARHTHYVPKARVNAELPAVQRLLTRIPRDGLNALHADDRAAIKHAIRAAKQAGANVALAAFGAQVLAAAGRKTTAAVQRVVECVGSEQKILVFTGLRRHVDEIEAHTREAIRKAKLGDCPIWAADGSVPADRRRQIQQAYMAAPGPAVLIGTRDAWGMALNLQSTDRLLSVALPWTWLELEQAEGRVVRLGMDRRVVIEYLIAEGTVDTRVAEVVLAKLGAINALIQDDQLTSIRETLQGGSDADLMDNLIDAVIHGGVAVED